MKRFLLVMLLCLLPLVTMAQRKYNVWIASAPIVPMPAQTAGWPSCKLDSLAGLDFTKPYTALTEVYITDSSNQKANFEIWFYRDRPDSSSFGAVFVLKATELSKVCGVLNVPTTAYFSGGSPATAAGLVVPATPILIRLSSTRRYVYYKLVGRGTPTYGSPTVLKLTFCFEQQ